MAITINSLQKRRIINQIETNLVQLQRDIRTNALSYKARAQAQSLPLARLQAEITADASEYLRRLQWVIDLRADAGKRQRLLDMLATAGWSEQEIVTYVTELRDVAVGQRDANISTYTRIANVSDAIVTAVDPVDSLWPE